MSFPTLELNWREIWNFSQKNPESSCRANTRYCFKHLSGVRRRAFGFWSWFPCAVLSTRVVQVRLGMPFKLKRQAHVWCMRSKLNLDLWFLENSLNWFNNLLLFLEICLLTILTMIVELHERTYMTHGATTNKEKSDHSWSSRIWLCSTGVTPIDLWNERNEARLRSSKSLWEDAVHSLQVSGWAPYSGLLWAQQISTESTCVQPPFHFMDSTQRFLTKQEFALRLRGSVEQNLYTDISFKPTWQRLQSCMVCMFLACEVEPPIHVVLWLLGASELQLRIGTNGAIAGATNVSRDEIHKEIQWWSKTPKVDHWRVTMQSNFFVSMALKSECSRCFNALQIHMKWTCSTPNSFDEFPKQPGTL